MGNAHREYIAFTKGDYWELWQCRGNAAYYLGDNSTKRRIANAKKCSLVQNRLELGFTKFYGNREEVEEYLFILAV